MNWDWRKERNEKHRFVEERLQHRRPVLAVACIFTIVWLSGWATSALLLHQGMHSIPARYAISTLVSYVVFVYAVGVWCHSAAQPVKPNKAGDSSGNILDGMNSIPGDEGCLIVLAVAFVALLLSGVFWLLGGYAMLLEVAFEVAFAGTMVYGLDRRYTLGNWSGVLLKRTWVPALVVGCILVGFGGKMQHDHPEALTIAQAFKAQRGHTK